MVYIAITAKNFIPPLIGFNDKGGFKTTPAAAYPTKLNKVLAQAFLESLQNGVKAGRATPFPILANGNMPNVRSHIPHEYVKADYTGPLLRGSQALQM